MFSGTKYTFVCVVHLQFVEVASFGLFSVLFFAFVVSFSNIKRSWKQKQKSIFWSRLGRISIAFIYETYMPQILHHFRSLYCNSFFGIIFYSLAESVCAYLCVYVNHSDQLKHRNRIEIKDYEKLREKKVMIKKPYGFLCSHSIYRLNMVFRRIDRKHKRHSESSLACHKSDLIVFA